MGHKVNPISFRLGKIFTWNSRWFADKDKYRKYLREDIMLRKYIQKKQYEASVSKIEIDRSSQKLKINIHAGKPGVIIGRGGTGIEEMKKDLKQKFFANKKVTIEVNIFEVTNSNLDPTLVVQLIAQALEKRVPFRKAVKQSMMKVERAGAKGVKIRVSGRLNGAEIARTETFTSGKIPLHTIRANIEYSRGAAHTTYGAIGIKVWIYKGEIFNDKKEQAKSMSK